MTNSKNISKIKILGIIPARAGSKRVLQKNFKPFADTTLTDLAISQALEATLLDNIVVSSDSKEVIKIAEEYEGIVTLERPSSIAQDETPAIDYMMHVISNLEQQGEQYDLVVIIQPSSPLRHGKDIDNTIHLLMNNPDASSAVSVVKLPHMVHPHKLKIMQGALLTPWLVDEKQKTAAQDLPDIYSRNCAVYVFRTENLKQGVTLGNKSVGYIMPQHTSVDINDPMEFEFAEYLHTKKHVQ